MVRIFYQCYVLIFNKMVFFLRLRVRWVTESKRIEVQVGKILSFKPRVGKVKRGQTTGEFIAIYPENYLWSTKKI